MTTTQACEVRSKAITYISANRLSVSGGSLVGSVTTGHRSGRSKAAEWVPREEFSYADKHAQNESDRHKRLKAKAHKNAQAQLQDEWAELAAEEALFKKFKKGNNM